jgi:hypothetical protein
MTKLKDVLFGDRDRFCCAKFIDRNENKDCIVAYFKDTFGGYVIIKSSRKFFAILSLSSNIRSYTAGFNQNFRVELKEAMQMINQHNGIIENQELWNELNKTILLEGLENGN